MAALIIFVLFVWFILVGIIALIGVFVTVKERQSVRRTHIQPPPLPRK